MTERATVVSSTSPIAAELAGLAVDHLVIAAATLAQGRAWCERTLGVMPSEGGRHAFMGTHNAVFPLSAPGFPKAYAEIIAIDPDAPAPAGPRWFELDDPVLQGRLAQGPQLVQWVARCDDIEAARAALQAAGVDVGEVTRAERATPRGVLRWQITLRADGRRALAGAAPPLIAWGDVHPTDGMGASAVQLVSLGVAAPELAALLPAALRAADPAVPLSAVLRTPLGRVVLNSV